MSKGGFNGNMWADGKAAITTLPDAIGHIIQGFQQTGKLCFGSGQIGQDQEILIVVGKTADVAPLIVQAMKKRMGIGG